MKKRKQIYSMTIDPELVERVLKLSKEDNFSKIVRLALEKYIEDIEKQNNK